MYQACGYKTITPIQLFNVLGAYDTGGISFRALRVYFGCFELRAIREAARRSRTAEAVKTRRGECYRIAELVRLLGAVTEAQVKSALRQLERAGLVRFSESAITFTETTLPAAQETILRIADSRKAARPIPVPRRVLRFLARCTKPALMKTCLAYLIRGLSFDHKSGEVRGVGTVKASWISRVFAISERAVRAARRELIRLGWIDKDTGSKQRKLNRDGAYFRINLDWKDCEKVIPSESAGNTGVGNLQARPPRFAPHEAENSSQFAPPLKRLKTSTKYNNQELATDEPSGFCGRGMFRDLVQSVVTGISFNVPLLEANTQILKPPANERAGMRPSLKNIKPEDLRRLPRLSMLYEQATQARWLERSEANFLNFAAAAVRANRAKGDTVRIFVGIVKRGLWGYITQGEEDRARQLISCSRKSPHSNASSTNRQRTAAPA